MYYTLPHHDPTLVDRFSSSLDNGKAQSNYSLQLTPKSIHYKNRDEGGDCIYSSLMRHPLRLAKKGGS